MAARLSRRDFLKLSGIAGSGLIIAIYLEGCKPGESASPTATVAQITPENLATARPPFTWVPNLYIAIDQDGGMTLTAFRSEMGQGIRTALAMLVAEELDIAWSSVRIVQADADSRYGNQQTGGSVSISTYHETMRQAGATAAADAGRGGREGLGC